MSDHNIDWDAIGRMNILRADAFRRALGDFDKSLLIDLITDLSRADTPDRLVAWLIPRARLQRAQSELDALNLQMSDLRAPLRDGRHQPSSRSRKTALARLREVESKWFRAHDEVVAALEEVSTKKGGLPR